MAYFHDVLLRISLKKVIYVRTQILFHETTSELHEY